MTGRCYDLPEWLHCAEVKLELKLALDTTSTIRDMPKYQFSWRKLKNSTGTVNDLGLKFYSNLTYNEYIHATFIVVVHIQTRSNKLSKTYIPPTNTYYTIIDALVMSKIDYCSSVWVNSSDENIKKIQLIQNFAARLITGSHKYDNITLTLKELYRGFQLNCIFNIKILY